MVTVILQRYDGSIINNNNNNVVMELELVFIEILKIFLNRLNSFFTRISLSVRFTWYVRFSK